jgi:DNA-binding winged helix-turn-helix (wHTH) protein/DNA-binding CsgD family transcriptional regulator
VIYRFGDIELDTTLFELRRRGVPVSVEPQVFDVLTYLIVHRDRVVTKEELLDNVWGDRFVSESALTTRIKTARRAVGDDGQSQHVVRTVHGRGYRFVAPVAELDDAAVVEPEIAVAEVAPPAPVVSEPPAEPSITPPEPVVNVFSAVGDAPHVVSWPLLGRSDEIEAIAAAFQDPRAGGVLLTGGAGVGKTRLADECLRLAAEAGLPVARIAGHPETKRLPLAALAHLLPSEVTRPSGPEGELDRALLFHRARAALQEVKEGRRWVVMVDDVDQLDELSRALLVSLVHTRTCFVVGTIRTTGSNDDDVRTLVKETHLRRLEPSPLAADTVEALLHRVLGSPIADDSLEQLVAAATGNPGVLRQLVESARDAGNLVERDGVWHLTRPLVHASPTFELLVAERLAGLRQDEREVVELLAVAGELGLDLLERMAGGAILEELERRGLLMVTRNAQRIEVSLSHPLFGEVINMQLPAVRGRRIRRTLADAVSADGARRRGDRVRVVAWSLEGGGHVDVCLLAEAARLALVEGDEAMAERILAQAPEGDRTPEIIQLVAELRFRRGQTHEVEELLASIDNDELDDQARAQVARRRATNLFFGQGDYSGAVALLDSTHEVLSDTVERDGVEAYIVLLQAMGGEVCDALARSDGIGPMSSDIAQLDLLRGRGLALAVAGRGEEALPLLAEAHKLHDAMSADLRRPGLSLVLFAEVLTLGELGRMDAARAGVAKAREKRIPAMRDWMLLAEARLDLSVGRPADQRGQLIALVRNSRGLGLGATERWALALVASGKLLEGDREGARVDLDRVAELEVGERGLFHTDIDRAHAWLAAERAGLPTARELLRVAADDARRLGKYAMEAALLHDIARFGDAESVVDRLAQLAARCQGNLVRARAAHAAGIASGDPALLDRAAALFEQCGFPLLAAEARVDQADALARRGDQRGATAARNRSAAIRDTLPGWVITPTLSRSAALEPLSDREHEVALLAGQGMSSRDIAERLFVSTRTVDNHLQHIYAKLGVSGRDQLVAALRTSAPRRDERDPR